jgi:plastocyanin
MPRLPQVAAVGACVPVLCAAGALASCGGGGEQPAGQRAVTVPATRGVHLSAREYSFDPSKLIVTGGGGALKITLRNRGSLAHDVHVLKGGRDLGGTPSFEGGSRSAVLTLAPGRYRMICTVGDHAQLGMRASLDVRR